MLTAYAQVAPAGALQLWVGVYGIADPALPQLEVEGVPQVEVSPLAWGPLRDGAVDAAGRPLNHRAILRATGLRPGASYRVRVSAAGHTLSLATNTLPDDLPQKLEGSFNVLLCSCYSQPEDASGLLGTVVSQIRLRPHMTMMLGDQVYGDLPLFENLPSHRAGISAVLGQKYRRNWVSSQLGTGGLGPVLSRAPVVCVADDHEYWNNYPFAQTQLPTTWTEDGRCAWKEAATALYEDYQLTGPSGAAQRIDVGPLKMLVVDMRSARDEAFDALVSPSTLAQVAAWEADLTAERASGRPAFGLLSSGQALFVEPTDETRRKHQDAEMSNYAQFDTHLVPTLERLSSAGIPVVYVTGDVHWGRLSQARDLQTGRLAIHEVIASPSRLIRIPVLDGAKEVAARAKGLFDRREPWPRHSASAPVPKRLGRAGRFRLEFDADNQWGHAKRGDQVAVMSFCRAGGGIDFNVTYYAITEDKALGKSDPSRTYELRNF